MEELTLELKLQNVTEEQEQQMKQLQADIEADADFVAANTLEEAYVAVKKYVKLTLEQFKAAYESVKERVAGLLEEMQAKRELSDEELDIVAGGGWFSWKKLAVFTAVAGFALLTGGLAATAMPAAIAGLGMIGVSGTVGTVVAIAEGPNHGGR